MPRFVVIGNLCVDTLIHPDGRREESVPGGSALFGSLGLRLWTDGVGMLARMGEGYPEEAIELLRGAGIDTAGVIRRAMPAVHNLLDYRGDQGRRLTHLAGTPLDNSPCPEEWPAEWTDVEAVHIGSMPVEVQVGWLDLLAEMGAAVSLDPHLRSCREERDLLQRSLSKCDLFIPSDLEVRQLFPGRDLMDAAGEVDTWVREGAIVTCGAEGALVPRQGRRLGALPGVNVVDQTGAGDSYAASFVWCWSQTRDIVAAHRHGAVAAAAMIEGHSGLHTLALPRSATKRRLEAWLREQPDIAEDLTHARR